MAIGAATTALQDASNSFPGMAMELVGSMWMEISFLVFFTLGFLVLRFELFSTIYKSKRGARGGQTSQSKLRDVGITETGVCEYTKSILADAASEQPKAVLMGWDLAKKSSKPLPADALKAVAQALVVEKREDRELEEMLDYVRRHRPLCAGMKASNAILDPVARAGKVELMEKMARVARTKIGVSWNNETFEILLGGYANVGDVATVDELVRDITDSNQKLTARAFSVMIKGCLKNKKLSAAQRYLLMMPKLGFYVPSFAVTQLLKLAVEQKQAEGTLDRIQNDVVFPAEAVALLLEYGGKENNLELMRRVEKIALETKLPLLYSSYECLVKGYAAAGEPRAAEVFEEMTKRGFRITEGTCVGIISHCAEGKDMKLAERVFAFARENKLLTLGSYSALMKVYAYLGMYGKACDLYEPLTADGLEPDAIMYGCLMKFAVECGRTELSQMFFKKTPNAEIQNYMAVIQACGRERNLKKALEVFETLKASKCELDLAAFNCVLDVCVTVGDMAAARKLLGEMREAKGAVDVISYNTLMKGYCSAKDLKGAWALLTEMQEDGQTPNDVSYNCMINAAASAGRFREAWEIIDEMERKGIASDHFTCSIMMKALKSKGTAADMPRVMALLDRANMDVCGDEVLLNTVLDTLIRLKQTERLVQVLTLFKSKGMKPSVHTYGTLIKAFGSTGKTGECRKLWEDMTEGRSMEPNEIVLGCMIDALVVNGELQEALRFFKSWKGRIPANTVMYSSLIKGFAQNRDTNGAMEMYEMMRGEKIAMNTIVFNALIDSCARVGAMDTASKLVEDMTEMGVELNMITYSTIIKGYSIKGDMERALAVFHSIEDHEDRQSDAVMFNTLLDGCVRHNRFELADRLLEDMKNYKVAPSNFTLTILVKMWGRRKVLDKAFEAVEVFPRQNNFKPNVNVLTCLISACLANNALDKGMEVFAKMQEDQKTGGGCGGPDGKTYSVLIQGLARQGRLTEAVALLEKGFGLQEGPGGSFQCWGGVQMEPLALQKLLEAMVKFGQVEQLGMPLMERLRSAKAPFDQKLFATTMKNAAVEAQAGGAPPLQQQAYRSYGGATENNAFGGKGKGKSGQGGGGGGAKGGKGK